MSRDLVIQITGMFIGNWFSYPVGIIIVVYLSIRIIAKFKPSNPWLWSIPIWSIFLLITSLTAFLIFSNAFNSLDGFEGLGFFLFAISHLVPIIFGGIYIYYLRRKKS